MLKKPYNARHVVEVERLHKHHSLFMPDIFVENERERRCNSHKTETAYLNEQNKHDLTEKAPVRKRVVNNKPGNACR